jgi:hypothetical protein
LLRHDRHDRTIRRHAIRYLGEICSRVPGWARDRDIGVRAWGPGLRDSGGRGPSQGPPRSIRAVASRVRAVTPRVPARGELVTTGSLRVGLWPWMDVRRVRDLEATSGGAPARSVP